MAYNIFFLSFILGCFFFKLCQFTPIIFIFQSYVFINEPLIIISIMIEIVIILNQYEDNMNELRHLRTSLNLRRYG